MTVQTPGLNDQSPTSGSLIEPSYSDRKPTTLEFYREFRLYINDENNLINNRITWILTIHGFLYATYGFTLQKQLEVVSKPIHRYLPEDLLKVSSACNAYAQSEFFLIFITAVGMMISISGIISINAATSAIRHIGRLFRIQTRARSFDFESSVIGSHPMTSDTSRDTICYETESSIFLPAMTGGASLTNADAGFPAARLIPKTLLVSWILSLTISIWLSHFPFHARCGYNLLAFIASVIR